MRSMILVLLLAQPQIPQGPPAVPGAAKFLNYADAYELAWINRRPLVVFLGVPARSVGGAVIADVPSGKLKGYQAPAIIVAMPGKDEMEWAATLPARATDQQIRDSFRPKAVQPMAAPFSQESEPLPPAVPDDDGEAAVAAVIEGMEAYQTARLAQVSGNRSGHGANYAYPRESTGAKWMVPGGMEGLTGWSNRLYRGRGNRVRNWFERADPSDTYVVSGGEVWGSEFIYKREYTEGSEFADVLSTAKGVFEVRLARREKGGWLRTVPYRNQDAAPEGYIRVPTAKCAECHSQAGSGSYGSARVPGGGGVISEPLAGVEQ